MNVCDQVSLSSNDVELLYFFHFLFFFLCVDWLFVSYFN